WPRTKTLSRGTLTGNCEPPPPSRPPGAGRGAGAGVAVAAGACVGAGALGAVVACAAGAVGFAGALVGVAGAPPHAAMRTPAAPAPSPPRKRRRFARKSVFWNNSNPPLIFRERVVTARCCKRRWLEADRTVQIIGRR